jgi:hypothetical protein
MTLISKEPEDVYCHSFQTTNFILHPTPFPGLGGRGKGRRMQQQKQLNL